MPKLAQSLSQGLGLVRSVFGRTGNVVAAAGDYTASQVTNTSGVAGATVAAALNTLAALPTTFFGLYANRPAAGNAGRLAILTDSPTCLWIDDGTKWRPYINGALGLQPPLVSAMTAFNQGGATFTDNAGAIAVVGVNDGAAPGQLRGMVQAQSASTAYARGCFQFNPIGDVTANHFAAGTIVLRESATAKAYGLQIYQDFNGRATLMQATVWTGNATRPTTVDKGSAVLDAQGPLMMRARRNGANLFGEWSRDGNTWFQLDTRATGTVFTTAPDQAGWAANGINVAPSFNVLSFESGS